MSFPDSDSKITLFLALSIAALTGCRSAPPDTNAAALAGFWQCKTKHPAGQTTEHYTYLPESGQYQSVGRVAFQVSQGKYLIYARVSAGTWHLSGNRLVQRAYGSRAHPEDADLRARLKRDPQVSKALASYEQALNYGPDTQDTVYQVDRLTPTNLTLHTQLGPQRVSVDCVKPSENSVPAILRQRPAKIPALFQH